MTTLAEPHAHGPSHDLQADQPLLEHQYDSVEQQHESSMLGMWVFLATEVMFFGGLICSYIIFRAIYRDDFEAASHHLNVPLGAFNTLVLLSSSLTMALAVRASQLARIREAVILLIATMVFGTAFLGIKYIEYSHDYEIGLFPGLHWDWELAQSHMHHGGEGGREGTSGSATHASAEPKATNPTTETPSWYAATGSLRPDPTAQRVLPLKQRTQSDHAKLFFTYYFFMTGLHAIHLIIGIVLVGIVAFLTWRRWFSGTGATQIEVTGLYWHFIDIIWVYLYPALYLIDLSR
jgi:cytochrome c oxidase subunit 3